MTENFSILDITKQENRTPDRKKKSIPKIGYVYDKALWFYYPENLYALENSGCELVQFSILDESADNINKLKNDAKDVKEHLADYCYVEINDIQAIIEYLEQLKIIKE